MIKFSGFLGIYSETRLSVSLKFRKNQSRGGWNTKPADDKVIVEIHLFGRDCRDAPEGRRSIIAVGPAFSGVPREGDETRALALANGHEPVVPPKKNRREPWEYDKELYKRRNMVERFFRRIQEFRRVFTRYDKTDTMYLAFTWFSVIAFWLQ